MNYDEVTASWADYDDGGQTPEPTVGASPARRLRDAIEPIAMHSVWSRSVTQAQAELGLDFLSGYLWGRAAALGEPDPGVVVSSFAVFEPSLITTVYGQARAAVGREALLAVRTEATIASLTEALGDADVSEVADALRMAVLAADGTGRPLFSGFANQPWPEGPVGRLWHSCELLREHRGDGHVAVNVARGIGPVEMNILTELWVGMPLFSYTATRGWAPEVMEAAAEGLRQQSLMADLDLTDDGRALREAIEAETDVGQASIISALGGEFDRIVDLLALWSQRCVTAAAFPPDPFKRAAG